MKEMVEMRYMNDIVNVISQSTISSSVSQSHNLIFHISPSQLEGQPFEQ